MRFFTILLSLCVVCIFDLSYLVHAKTIAYDSSANYDALAVCQSLNRNDCEDKGFYSFVREAERVIKKGKFNRCSYLVVTQNIETKELTNSSYGVSIRSKTPCGTEYSHDDLNHQYHSHAAFAKCDNGKKSGEECVMLFGGTKMLIENFISQYANLNNNNSITEGIDNTVLNKSDEANKAVKTESLNSENEENKKLKVKALDSRGTIQSVNASYDDCESLSDKERDILLKNNEHLLDDFMTNCSVNANVNDYEECNVSFNLDKIILNCLSNSEIEIINNEKEIKFEEEKRLAKIEEEKRKAEEEKRKAEEEKRKAEEKKKAEIEQKARANQIEIENKRRLKLLPTQNSFEKITSLINEISFFVKDNPNEIDIIKITELIISIKQSIDENTDDAEIKKSFDELIHFANESKKFQSFRDENIKTKEIESLNYINKLFLNLKTNIDFLSNYLAMNLDSDSNYNSEILPILKSLNEEYENKDSLKGIENIIDLSNNYILKLKELERQKYIASSNLEKLKIDLTENLNSDKAIEILESIKLIERAIKSNDAKIIEDANMKID